MSRYVLLATLSVLPGSALADVDAGVTIGENGIHDFHLAVSAHYGVNTDAVAVVRSKGIPEDQLPVVFLITKRAGVSPGSVVHLRRAGKTWMEIALHFGLTAEIFHVAVVSDHGPPYGRALGHFKRKRNQWSSIRLADDEIVLLANLKFLSAHYGQPPDAVVKMHPKGSSFLELHGRLKRSVGKDGKAGHAARQHVAPGHLDAGGKPHPGRGGKGGKGRRGRGK